MFIDDSTRSEHMLRAANDALEFARGKTIDDIRNDRGLALILIKCLEMVGEASSKISRNLRDAHPQVPWRFLHDLRNHLVHDYFEIDVDRVWMTVQQDLPEIVLQLEALVN